MKTMKLRDGFYWAGIVDKNLKVFDIIMTTEFGTTYNSYIMKTKGKTILFDTAKEAFFDEYLNKLKKEVDVTAIDYLIVSHTEPDHAGSVGKLLDLNPQIKVIATGCAIDFLKEITNREFFSIAVKDNQEMKIGDKTLKFLIVPNLHWPDTMYVYIEEEQILITCDSFGAHYAFDDVLVSKVTDQEGYMRSLRYYFDCIMGPFKPYVLDALDRIRDLDLSMICTGHGPVLDTKIDYILNLYKEWSNVVSPNTKKTVIMPYVSAYGFTRLMAEKIAQGIKDSGDIDVRTYDMVNAARDKVLEELLYADGILFGTPTIVADALSPIWDLTSAMSSVTHGGKLAGVFGSYGWSGEGVQNITERLRQLKMKVLDPIRVRFNPSEVEQIDAYEYGYNFGCVLQEKENPKTKQGSGKLVKCLICGEIFDSSLEVCPVCGAGKENFVPVEIGTTTYRKDTDNYYVILGNGAAGLSAAKEIRKRDQTGSVVIVSEEAFCTYNRPMLTKALMADINANQIAVEDERWYEDHRIFQVLGKKIESIDVDKKEVVLSDQSRLKYTRLIYALGSECFMPPFAGSDKPEVLTIRRVTDTQMVTSLMKHTKEVVVIGGGVLGLEAAWEIKKTGCQVTVLELAPHLMGRQLDDEAGEMLKIISEGQGIRIHTGVSIAAIEGDQHVTGVRLDDGSVYPAQLVIVSCGVRPNIALAKEAKIETDLSVIVNEKMQTNIPDIYAAGDCAQYQGQNYAIWPQALEEGKVAGACAAGDPDISYEPELPALSFNGMNTSLFAIGDNGKNPNLIYKTLELKDSGKKQYQKYYFLNNRLCGAILIGDTSKIAEVTVAVNKRMIFREFVNTQH